MFHFTLVVASLPKVHDDSIYFMVISIHDCNCSIAGINGSIGAMGLGVCEMGATDMASSTFIFCFISG